VVRILVTHLRRERPGGAFDLDRQQLPDQRQSGSCQADKDQPAILLVAPGHDEATLFQPQHDVPDIGGLHGNEPAEKVL
jgi:hypothetical protein